MEQKPIVVVTMGISGAGKSTLYEKEYANTGKFTLICPDDIRKELTGSISDQSRNKEVWEVAYDRLATAIENGENVFFSATHCSYRQIKNTFNVVLTTMEDEEYSLFLVYLRDSENPDLCKSRVRNDLKKGVDRSNTLVMVDDTNDVIDRQYKTLMETLQSSAFHLFLKENSITKIDYPLV